MRDPRVVVAGNDGVPREIFSGDTARMKAEKLADLQVLAKGGDDDAIPSEMVGTETMRIEQSALTGLIEKSEGVAVGTPKRGLPQLEDPEIEVVLARGSSQEVEAVVVASEPVVREALVDSAVVAVEVAREPSRPVMRQSRMRDFMIGGVLSILVMVAWYCATQL